MICVYEKDCRDFSNNGLGCVIPESCTVTETLNGEYELTLVHPIDTEGKWERLSESRILRVPVPSSMTPELTREETPGSIYEVFRINTEHGTTPFGTLRLRSGPGEDARVLSTYKNGSEVIRIRAHNEYWDEVCAPDGQRGFMMHCYLELIRTEGSL